MADALKTFFSAWAETDPTARSSLIAKAVDENATYSDPRSGDRLVGVDAIAEYVSAFSANAPGWTAEVVKSDVVNGYARTVVKFGGIGPDGKEMAQHGTYFADLGNGETILTIAGFVGETPT